MDFGEVLSKAGQITWKYKVLWIFGILAGCSESSSGGSGGGNFNSGGRNMPGGNFPGGMVPPQLIEAMRWVEENVALFVIGICCFVLLFTALRVFLGTIGRIGLIHGTQRADQEAAPILTFGEVFSQSRRYFWRIFGLDFLMGVIVFAFILLIMAAAVLPFLPTIMAGNGSNSDALGGSMAAFFVIFFMCLCCILLPVGIVVGIVLQMVYTAIVVDNLSIGAGISKGWQVFKSNLGNVALMWLLLGILGGIVGFIISLPLIAAMLPVLLAFTGAENGVRNGLIGAAVCCAVYLPILLLLSGILRTYVQSGWTLTYLRLTGRQANSGLVAPAVAEVF